MKNKDACIIVGIARTAAENGRVSTNLHVKSSFDDFHNNPEAGRTCEGEKVESIYVGNYDCSELNVGDEIEILYGKAITTAKGTFQPVKRIDVLN